MTASISRPALAALAILYQDLQQEIQPHQDLCEMRGVCCDFPKAEHQLYVTGLELSFALNQATQEQQTQLATADGKLCPFWQKGLCKARELRPLGCRTYFCASSWKEKGEAIHEKYHQGIVKLHKQFAVEYFYQNWPALLRQQAQGGALD